MQVTLVVTCVMIMPTYLDDDMDDEANITYTLPTMGGLTAGVSFRDGGTGTDNNDDKTEYAAKYAMTAGGTNITLHYGICSFR